MAMARKVDPSGLPTPRNRSTPSSRGGATWETVVLSRKSCVTAMPIDAKARDVRNQARNVRSAQEATGSAKTGRQERKSRMPSRSISRRTQSQMISRHTPLILKFYAAVLLGESPPPSLLNFDNWFGAVRR